MFEKRGQNLLPRRHFLIRTARFALISLALIGFSLGIGTTGYHFVAGLAWIDAFLNASMILTGMGPVNPMTTAAAKLFASLYALFSGVAFLSATAVLLAPPVHRLLHSFHLEFDDEQGSQQT